MRILFEASVFSGIAVVAHVMFWTPPEVGGTAGAGAGGADAFSVAASNAAYEELVESWERPPQTVETDMPEMETPPPAEVAPVEAPSEIEVEQMAALPMPQMPQSVIAPQPDMPALPSYQEPPKPTEPAPSELAPEKSPRPTQRNIKPPKKTAKAEPKPRVKKPAQPSVDRAKQVAKGAGAGQAQGVSQQSSGAALPAATRNSLLSQWGGRIRTRIARNAPRGVGSGTAIVRLMVSVNGSLISVSLAQSSGNAKLDQLALKAVRSAGRFPGAPKQLGGGQHGFTLPIKAR